MRPAHTLADGDVIFSLATGTHATTPEPADLRAIEVLAALATERAIRNAVLAATTLAGIPAVRDLT